MCVDIGNKILYKGLRIECNSCQYIKSVPKIAIRDSGIGSTNESK